MVEALLPGAVVIGCQQPLKSVGSDAETSPTLDPFDGPGIGRLGTGAAKSEDADRL